jgi:hypothetical protein
MAKITSQGKCLLCQGTFGKRAMSRHLAKCLQGEQKAAPAVSKGKPKQTRLFHLVVQGTYNPQYWLHVELPAQATLYDLDAFLRDIWLECCGHLSQFEIEGRRYSVQPSDDPWLGEEEEGMDIALGEVLRPNMKFTYEYDFGSTTPLTLNVVSEREGKKPKERVRLLARNDPPAIPCGVCGAPATQVTSEGWREDSWLCEKCAKGDDVDEESLLPVVDSPRVGVCGYTG